MNILFLHGYVPKLHTAVLPYAVYTAAVNSVPLLSGTEFIIQPWPGKLSGGW